MSFFSHSQTSAISFSPHQNSTATANSNNIQENLSLNEPYPLNLSTSTSANSISNSNFSTALSSISFLATPLSAPVLAFALPIFVPLGLVNNALALLVFACSQKVARALSPSLRVHYIVLSLAVFNWILTLHGVYLFGIYNRSPLANSDDFLTLKMFLRDYWKTSAEITVVSRISHYSIKTVY